MKRIYVIPFAFACIAFASHASPAHAALTLTAGNNATTTPNVATSITGFQIVGPAASTTPVKIHVTSGTVHVSAVSGVTASGNGTATLSLAGAVADLNVALSSLTYTRSSTGTDTLEVSLVESDEVFFPDNGHLYAFTPGSYTWANASTSAAAQTAYGVNGYLATITSSAENAFIKARLTGDGWLGASDMGVEGDWKWVTGPEAGTLFWRGTGGGSPQGGNYANWTTGEPNQSGDEDCLQTYVASGKWNDLGCGSSMGYVVEFGAGERLPTVVAKDVSIVTADVPAVTTLSPANGATGIAPATDLVIGFSKSVTKQAGEILVRARADDRVAAAIDAAGDQVSGSGTNTITIDPGADLAEGTAYYVTVPGTAFKDNADNPFDGITDDTTWTFTTSDGTAPALSSVAALPATTSAAITWTTGEAGSSKVVYGPTSAYGAATSVTDTAPRVTSHARDLSGLLSCTLYHYAVVSTDGFANTATSTDAQFLTTGCIGAQPSSTYAATVPTNAEASTTLAESGRTLVVTTPAHFTATSSTVVIQIKAMDTETTLAAIQKPSPSLESAAAVAFEVTALIDSTTVLDSFDAPVTITYQYTDEDIEGLVESSLTMYHYHDDVWSPLNACSLDTAANTISCDAPSFSTFAIFGSLQPSASTGGSHARGTSVPARVHNLVSLGMTAEAEALKAAWPNLFSQEAAGATPIRDLELSMTGEDVRLLQALLNANGSPVAASGPGAPGSETAFFGTLTKAALAAYQTAYGILPSAGYFGPITRAQMKAAGVAGTWW